LESLCGLESILLQPPPVDGLDVEPPIASNLESRQIAALELAIDGGRMDFQVVRELLNRQNMGVLSFHIDALLAINKQPMRIIAEQNAICVPPV
jgi:hypothetical protein